jgi:hypothetical protein
VVEVEDLDEWLHLGSLLNLLLVHGSRNLAWISINSSNCMKKTTTVIQYFTTVYSADRQLT